MQGNLTYFGGTYENLEIELLITQQSPDIALGVNVECFGTERQSQEFIKAFVKENYDLRPRAIIERLGLLDFDYSKVSAYGHFGKRGLPWEE